MSILLTDEEVNILMGEFPIGYFDAPVRQIDGYTNAMKIGAQAQVDKIIKAIEEMPLVVHDKGVRALGGYLKARDEILALLREAK